MINSTSLRLSLLGAAAALAVAAPAANAKVAYDPAVSVCQEATHVSLGGDLHATDGDPVPPARYTENLFAHRGKGVGLQRAARQSPALSICGAGDFTGGEDGDGAGQLPDFGAA